MSAYNAIRQTMRRRRQGLGCGAQIRAARRLSVHISRTLSYQHSQHIAVYWAVNGEIDLRFVIKKAWSQGKYCYLPILDGQQLRFVRYGPATLMGRNRFGIPEPRIGQTVSANRLDLVLVPLLAFDKNNHRIGMGGGFYDRTFAATPNSRRQAYLMGVGHRFQEVAQIVPADWDVPMDEVASD